MKRLILLGVLVLFLAACGSSEKTVKEIGEVEVIRIVEVTREVEVTRVVEVKAPINVLVEVTPVPTAMPEPTPSALPTATPSATPAPTELPPVDTPTLTPEPEPQTQAKNDINIRGGPGTNYAITGALTAGSPMQPVARNGAGDWFQIARPDGSAGWVAGWLLTGAPSPESLPIASDIPTPPPPPPTAPAVASTTQIAPRNPLATAPLIHIGEEIEIEGWRFKVNSVHKRKTIYFYGDSYIAFGNFLIVILDATNLQSGSDYFARNLSVRVLTFPELGVLMSNSKADRYAQWQYDGISSVYADVNPGVFSRMALAFDIPDDTLAVGITFADDVRGPFIPFIEMSVED